MRSHRCEQILDLIDSVLEELSDLPGTQRDVIRDQRLLEVHGGEGGDDVAPAAA